MRSAEMCGRGHGSASYWSVRGPLRTYTYYSVRGGRTRTRLTEVVICTYAMNANCKLRFSLKSHLLFSCTSPLTCLVMTIEAHSKFLPCVPSPKMCARGRGRGGLSINSCGRGRGVADANLRSRTPKCPRPHISGGHRRQCNITCDKELR